MFHTAPFRGSGQGCPVLKSMSARLTILALACLISASALALADNARQVNVPAGNLIEGLESLAKQCGVDVIYPSNQLKGLKTRGVSGTLEPKEAFRRLIEGTPLILKEQRSAVLISLPGASTRALSSNPSNATGSDQSQEGKKSSSQDFRLAQSTPGEASGPAPVDQEEQKSPTQNQEGKGMAEILIKGSRTLNLDVVRSEDDVQPYTIFDSTQIAQSSASNIEDFLKQQLTMNTSVEANAQAVPGNPNGATSSINLRGLGSNETLILVDGRRSASVNISGFNETGALNQPDINGIPLSAVERIEVLPSSASAIYGGAAVGGVINIILKRSFNGGTVGYSYDRAQGSGANRQAVNASFGTTFFDGRTQLMVAGSYSDGAPLIVHDREDLVNRGVSTILGNSRQYLYNPFEPFSGATPNITSALGDDLILKNGTPLNSPITYIPSGVAAGTDLTAGLLANAGRYNLNLPSGTGIYGAQGPIGVVPLTKSLIGTIRQSIFSDAQLFAEVSTTSNATGGVYNPFGGGYTVDAASPSNPFQQDVTLTFPSAEAPVATSNSVTQSVTVGMTAPISHSWNSELDYTWSRSMFDELVDFTDPQLVLDVASGVINPFVDTIAHPLDLSAYLSPQAYSGGSTLNDVNLRASGTGGYLPAGKPTFTIGLEHRREGSQTATINQTYPLTPSSNLQRIFFGQPQSTDSVYAEAQIPIVGMQNARPMVNSLDLQLAGRSERYSVSASTLFRTISPVVFQQYDPPQGAHATITYTSTNPTIGLKYRPIRDVILRASYSSAFLPPTAGQFLRNNAPVYGYPAILITDPANGHSYNVDETAGGNPNLKPQTSRDWDFGVIWEPGESVLRGIRMDVEFYRITQPNYITAPTPQQVIDDPSLASRVTRDPATGLIKIVDTSYLNATEYRTSGWDLKLDYSKDTRLGALRFHAAGTYIKYDQRQYGLESPFLEYAGFPNDGGEAKLKGNATLSWNYRHWTAAWSSTYYSSYRQIFSPGSPSFIQVGGAYSATADAQGSNSIPSQMYHDVFLSYGTGPRYDSGRSKPVDSVMSNLTIEIGVKNVFNTLPPFDAAFIPYFYSQYGDPWLRTYRISVKKEF